MLRPQGQFDEQPAQIDLAESQDFRRSAAERQRQIADGSR